ncbi:MAG: hypothetical protein AB7U23_09995 [Dehalococcoidia bacterium]
MTDYGTRKTPLARLMFELDVDGKSLGEQLQPPVSKTAISRWANRKDPIPPARVPQIAAVLGVEPSALLEENGEGDAA